MVLRGPGPWASASYARLLRRRMGCTRTCRRPPPRARRIATDRRPLAAARRRRGRIAAVAQLRAAMTEPRSTILLVEDDRPTRTFLADNLAADGYEPIGAATVREAVRLMETRYPDLAIVDLTLPDRDGLELLR